MSIVIKLYRIRGALLMVAVGVCLLGAFRLFLPPNGILDSIFSVLPFLGMTGILAVLLLAVLLPNHLPQQDQIIVTAPVTGRWLGMNSPIDKVPSHGVRAYGQAYALDLVYEPSDADRPEFGTGEAMRMPQEYPAFGQPVHAMFDGVVVRALNSSSWPSIIYMMLEGAVRELGGPRFIVGNHVILRGDDGVYALVAHLMRGSVLVKEGDQVLEGQTIARCGKSGNSSEPHVHAQLMDRASLWTAQGIPFAFARVQVGEDKELRSTLPSNGQHVTIDPFLAGASN